MQAVTVKCPECNGLLSVSSGDVVKCTYCGADARIQRRTMLQMPRVLPPRSMQQPIAVAKQAVNGKAVAGIIIFLVLATVVLPVTIALVAARNRAKHIEDVFGPTGTSTAKIDPAEPPHWKGGVALVFDADKDGSDDFIGIRRYYANSKDAMSLFALSGKDGHIVWETKSLGKYNDVYQSKLALVGGVLLRGDNVANLWAYSAKDGTQLWKQPQGEVVDKFCATEATGAEAPAASPASEATGSVRVKLADTHWWIVTLATGERTAAPIGDESCGLIQVANNNKTTNFLELDDSHNDLPGMSISKLMARGKGPVVARGYKRPGTAISMLAAMDPTGKKALWTAEIPAQDPLRSQLWGNDNVVIDDTHVAAFYEYQDSATKPYVTMFDRATGARQWNVQLDHKGTGSISLYGFAISNDAVALFTSDEVYVYDLATGKQRWVIREK